MWVWFFLCMLAQGAPTLIWQSHTATPQAWNKQGTKGMFVFPLLHSRDRSVQIGPFPMHWEVESTDGKEHTLSIQCLMGRKEIYVATIVVPATGKRITSNFALPMQKDENYSSSLDCQVKEGSKVLANDYVASYSYGSSLFASMTLMLDTETARQSHAEWMIATTNHQDQGVLLQIEESSWLPTDSMGYFAVRTVVWFADERSLDARQEQALFDWVQQGGHVVVVSSQGFSKKSLWSPWLEPRFAYTPIGERVFHEQSGVGWNSLYSEWTDLTRERYAQAARLKASGSTDVEAYRVGRGRVSLVPDRISAEEVFWLLQEPKGNQTGYYQVFGQENDNGTIKDTVVDNTKHPFFNENYFKSLLSDLDLFTLLSNGQLLLLLGVFTILIGPLNMFWKGKRLHWIWRTPLISAGCVLFVFGVNWTVSRGARGASLEFAVWDARTEMLTLQKQRVFFVGKSDFEEMPVVATAQFYPTTPTSRLMATLHDDNGEKRWSGIGKLREVYGALSWHTLTQRRAIRVDDGVLYNDLDCPIQSVLYRSDDGRYWGADTVKSGGSVSLTPVDDMSQFTLGNWYPNSWKSTTTRTTSWDVLAKRTVLFSVEERPVGWDASKGKRGELDKIDAAISKSHTIVYGVLP